MDLTDYGRLLRRRWAWTVGALLITIAAGLALVGYGPTTYSSAQTHFLVNATQDTTSSDARLNSYAELVKSPAVVNEVRRQLALDTPATDVARQLSAEVKANTLILTLTATDSTAEGARTLATSASRQLVTLTSSLSASDQAAPRLVATDAATPAVPATDGPRTVALAVLLGLLVGMLLTLVREATDSRIRSADQLRRLGVTGVPVVEIPEMTQAVPDGDVPPGIRVLRTVLFRTNRDHPATLVVCSCDERHPLPEVAPSLGIALARATIDVVLVSADLRPGRRTSADGTSTELGLGDALTDAPASDGLAADGLVRPGAHPKLWELPAGRVVTYPEDALGSSAMAHAADSLRNTHDVVVIQVPPLDVGAEALAVAEATQAVVLLTVARGRTHRKQVRAALAMLASAGVPVAAIALVASARRHAVRPARPSDGGRVPAADEPEAAAAPRSGEE